MNNLPFFCKQNRITSLRNDTCNECGPPQKGGRPRVSSHVKHRKEGGWGCRSEPSIGNGAKEEALQPAPLTAASPELAEPLCGAEPKRFRQLHDSIPRPAKNSVPNGTRSQADTKCLGGFSRCSALAGCFSSMIRINLPENLES